MITVERAREMLGAGFAIRALDVRSAADFATGHIPGAINIPMEQVESRMADLPQQPLLLICEAGKRAEVVSGWLEGQREVSVLSGGTRAWREAGYPLVVCAPCRWTLERQVRLIAGILVLAGTLLAVLVNLKWIYLAMFVGAGLSFAGLTNVCGMAMVLAKMPWNSSPKRAVTPSSPEVNCCT